MCLLVQVVCEARGKKSQRRVNSSIRTMLSTMMDIQIFNSANRMKSCVNTLKDLATFRNPSVYICYNYYRSLRQVLQAHTPQVHWFRFFQLGSYASFCMPHIVTQRWSMVLLGCFLAISIQDLSSTFLYKQGLNSQHCVLLSPLKHTSSSSDHSMFLVLLCQWTFIIVILFIIQTYIYNYCYT